MLGRHFYAIPSLAIAGALCSTAAAQLSVPTPDEVLAGWGGTDSRLDLNQDGIVNGADHAIALHLRETREVEVVQAVSGTGFASETPEPPVQGISAAPGYTARAIGRWNFVPHQTFTGPFNVGVVAFHGHGINRVEFSVNGGPWVAVHSPSLNPSSQTVEYWVRVDPTGMTPGEAEIRAVVYPNVGACRVLGGGLFDTDTAKGEYGMFFVADPGTAMPRTERFVSPLGSDTTGDGSATNPFKSIMKAAKSIALANGGKADGGIINLLPGNHIYGTYTYSLMTVVEKRWITIRPAPGVAAAAAPIVGRTSGGTGIKLVRFEGVEFRPTTNNTVIVSGGTNTETWLDGCRLVGCGREVSGDWLNGWAKAWSTNCVLTDSANGLGCELVRGLQIGIIASDAFSGARLAVNSTVASIDRGTTGAHPDFFQLYTSTGGVLENRIVYGCKVLAPIYSQGFFAASSFTVRDIAFVNCDVDTRAPGNVMRAFQFGGPTDHMLVQGCKIFGSARWAIEGGFMPTNVVLRENEWSNGVPDPESIAGVLVE